MSELKMLAIDLGASSGRGIVGSFDGKKLYVRENHRFPNEPVNTCGSFCWDILRIFHEIKSSISKCALSDDKDIKSIGIDTWGVDYSFVDKRGMLMANPYHYRDARTDGIQPYAFNKVPFADEALCSKIKKYAKLGVWILSEYEDLEIAKKWGI